MAPLTFQLLNLFGKPPMSGVACRWVAHEEVILWYLTVHTWLLGTLLVVSLFVLATRLFGRSFRFGQHQNQPPDSSVSEPDIQLQYLGLCWRGSRRDRDIAQSFAREGRALIPLYEHGVAVTRRCRQRDDLQSGIRGGAGDEAETESPNEHVPTTGEPDHQDDQESAHHLENMSEYLELEDLLEATIDDFDELESHHDGTLLREALIRNERRRLRRDYRELKERLDHHMRLLGLEPEELDTEGVDGLGRTRIRVAEQEVYADGPSPRRRRHRWSE
ncbi:hypothetical protein AYL99_02572 [Fonsecaea erecta]|uniref:Uncharacterized protein n=1 Tax=Fonsecaea erecta TaxID=1367422 RepID=A0A178ZWH0_9EURO|nr:hypothetical protein AYL99_02572 [Fonsecaea erecta]OAP63345.1 hypothetical protein AYL99_02572 [Fonsecaea erecta]